MVSSRKKYSAKAGTRAQACADFARKKMRERRRVWRKRSALAAGVMLVACIALKDMWMPTVPSVMHLQSRIHHGFWHITAHAGFALRQIYVHQRRYTAREDVAAIMDMQAGHPILALDLHGLKTELEAIPEIRRAHLSRALPHDLHLVLEERVPVARWQHKGVQRLIDEEGVLLNAERYAHRMQLPVVVGPHAPKHVGGLLHVLRSEPLLYANVAAAMRVGERRWNVRLGNGVTVMLPEENATHAWKRFAQLVREDAILTRAIDTIDLRMEDRVFITPVEQQQKATPVRFRMLGNEKDA
jgi:cell division protein FtsQ